MRLEMKEEIRAIQEKHNQLPEQNGLVTPNLKGIENRKSSKKKTKQQADNFGKLQKAISNAVAAGSDEDFNENELYNLM